MTTNEKLAILRFPQFTPATLVARDMPVLQDFIDEHRDVVVKKRGTAAKGRVPTRARRVVRFGGSGHHIPSTHLSTPVHDRRGRPWDPARAPEGRIETGRAAGRSEAPAGVGAKAARLKYWARDWPA